ncbi:MAG: hypothetical protein ACYC5O_20945 [Anaerolineae bacterium]
MRARLPLTVLLCAALILTFATPAVADGPVAEEGISAQALWWARSGGQPWQRGLVASDDTNDFGAFPSIAVDPADGDTWVAFFDDTNDDLVLAHRVPTGGNCGSGNSWYCYTALDTAGIVGLYPSIAIDPTTGNPGVAYYDLTNQQLKYTRIACGVVCLWLTVVVDTTDISDGTFTSLTFDSTGQAHIAYGAEFEFLSNSFYPVKYAHEVDSGGNCGAGPVVGLWQCDYIELAGDEPYASIDLNSAGKPRIAYYSRTGADLKYAYWVGAGGNCGPSNTTWQCITIDSANDVGRFASLSYASGDAQIAYYDHTAGTLKYALWHGGGSGDCGPANDWSCDVIDDVGIDDPVPLSLAVEGDGSTSYPYEPVIAYYDTSGSVPPHGVLKVARPALLGNCGPTAWILGHVWQCDELDDGFTSVGGVPYIAPHDVGMGVAVATNRTGLATIAYYDRDARDLLFVYQRYTDFLPLQLQSLPQP